MSSFSYIQSQMPAKRKALGLLVAAVTCAISGIQPNQSTAQEKAKEPATVRPTDNLTILGIPEIPLSLTDKVRKYTEARAASVLDWHPTQPVMLISTRFANSNQVHRVSTPGGSRYQLTFFNEPVGSAAYEPNTGDYFLFTKDVGGNEFGQIYRQDLTTGEATLLTDGGRSQNGGWVWNPLGKKQIAYSSTVRNGADRDIWIMDPLNPAESRLVVKVSGGGWSVQDWSPDGSKLLVMESLSINKTILYEADISKGAVSESNPLKPITDPATEVAYRGAKYSLDGSAIFTTSDADGEFQTLKKLDLKTKNNIVITNDLPYDVEAFELSHDGTKIAFSLNQQGVSQVYLLDTKTLKKTLVPGLPVGVATLGGWRPDDSEFAISITTAQTSSDVYSIDATKLGLTRWTESEMGGLVPSELPTAELVEWKSFDGKMISGFLYQPPKRFTGKRPVIINIHGGPEGQSRPNFLGRNNYFINELGCAMLFPNVRGSVGFGKSFMKLDNGFNRLDSVKDIGALLDWIKESKDLDANRIMITGGSYGGYMTLACAVDYNERIKCSLDVVGISHFGTFLKNTESYRRDLRRVEYGDERDEAMAAFFERTAPLNNAGKISKPLFVVQGGNDPRVPLSEAEQMVAKVKANGSPVWYLMANDEGHGFRKKNNADFQFFSTVLFVQEHLLK